MYNKTMTLVGLLGILSACQEQDVYSTRMKHSADALASTVRAEIEADAFGLSQVQAAQVVGSVFCATMSVTEQTLPITLSPELMNDGSCKIHIDAFTLNESLFVLSAEEQGQDWSRNSVHAFQNEEGRRVDLVVAVQLPQALAGGQTYQTSFKLYETISGGVLTAQRIEATAASTAEGNLVLTEGPNLRLVNATAEGGAYTLTFTCNDPLGDAMPGYCEGRLLREELLVLVADFSLPVIDETYITYSYGDVLADIGTENANGSLFFVNGENQIAVEPLETSVVITDIGFELTIPYSGSRTSLGIYLQYFDSNNLEDPFSSVTHAVLNL